MKSKSKIEGNTTTNKGVLPEIAVDMFIEFSPN